MTTPDDDLTALAIKHQADKWNLHQYTPIYHRHFSHLRNQPIHLLEIGVGGYTDPREGGYSLRMWKEYFPKAQIIALDLHPKHGIEEDRIKIYQGDQSDADFLAHVNEAEGPFDIVVDDGSHLSRHQIASFEILFPLLSDNGIYVCEDLLCSYWNNFGGDSFNLQNKKTTMNYFKQLTDCLNHADNQNPFYKTSYFDLHIVGIEFYQKMCFITKGDNAYSSPRIAARRSKSWGSKVMYYIKHRWLKGERKFRWLNPRSGN